MSTEVLKITSEEQYELAIAKIEELWDTPKGTPEFQVLQTLIDLVHEYENYFAETPEELN